MGTYGQFIREAREAAGFSRDRLADRMGQTGTTVQRLENQETEPSVEQINKLASILNISAEELLRRMDVNLNPPAAARLPRRLVTALLRLDPADLREVERIARALAALPREEREPAP